MKKIMMGLVIAVLATAQLANANTFMDRRALLDKTNDSKKKNRCCGAFCRLP